MNYSGIFRHKMKSEKNMKEKIYSGILLVVFEG